MRAYVLLGAAAALACGASVEAAVSLKDYNVIVTNYAEVSGHFHGKTAVGGNLVSNGSEFAKDSGITGTTLAVGGQVSGSHLDLGRGTMIYGSLGTINNLVLNGGSTKQQGTFDITPYSTLMSSTSSYFSGLGHNNNAPASGNNATFVASNVDGNGIASFEINGDWLSNGYYSSSILFSGIAAGTTVVINVSGSSINFNSGLNMNESNHTSQIIWNFYQATSINMSTLAGAFEGTILAPNATLTTNSKDINGNVYVKNLYTTNSTEFHVDPYGGYELTGSNPPVPEAASLALIVPAAAGLLLRRRKSA